MSIGRHILAFLSTHLILRKLLGGFWGADDIHGALNHITNSTIQDASREIKQGRTFNLDLELNFIPRPINPERRPVVHNFQPGHGYTDDVITLNTQMSTQYDSLRHFAYNDLKNFGNASFYQWYNDLILDYDEVIGYNHTAVLGIQQAAEKGIAARGVLLDYAGWAHSQNLSFDPFSELSVPASDLDKVAEWQGLNSNWSKPGDVLLIRWGWIEAFAKLNETQKQALVLGPGASIGLASNGASAKWVWDKKVAMVGSDNPAFEKLPIAGDFDGESRSLHEVFISGWGQSILEFINTEELVPALHEAKSSTFFLTIMPLNNNGGIASPPNTLAII